MAQNDSKLIKLADFSLSPGYRYISQETNEPNSGERFRKEILMPALSKSETISVDLNGVKTSILPSFLSESFEELAKDKGWDLENFKKHVTLISEEPIYIERTHRFVDRH